MRASLSPGKGSFSTDKWMMLRLSLPPYQPTLKFRANTNCFLHGKFLLSQPGCKSFKVEKNPILPKTLLQSENSAHETTHDLAAGLTLESSVYVTTFQSC